MQAEERGGGGRRSGPSRPPPRPPAPALVAAFSSAHSLDDSRKRCHRCLGSATVATLKEWHESPCFTPTPINDKYLALPLGGRLHVAG
eukprot:2103979-Pyramimonas_sp.AAC.1